MSAEPLALRFYWDSLEVLMVWTGLCISHEGKPTPLFAPRPLLGNQKYQCRHYVSRWKMAGPKLETRKAANLAYVEHRGPYDAVPWEDYVKRLYGWAKEQKVMPGFYPMAIYHDNPEKTPPENLRSDIGITFKGKAKEQAGVKTRKMPATKVATISHKGPGSEFKNTYAKLSEWIEKKGYQVSGPPIEVYSKKPEVVGGVTILYTKVMMPVKKK